jgi:hypothetical protein
VSHVDTECPTSSIPGEKFPLDEGSAPEATLFASPLRELVGARVRSLLDGDDLPRLFWRAGEIVELDDRYKRQRLSISPIPRSKIDLRLRRLEWVGREDRSRAIAPRRLLTSLVLDELRAKLPELKGFVRVPIFAGDESLPSRHGYHPSHRHFVDTRGLPDLDVPKAPRDAEVRQARRLLLEDLFGDLAFFSDRDQANALASLLFPLARRLIRGTAPIHRIETKNEETDPYLFAKRVASVLRIDGPRLLVVSKRDSCSRRFIESELEKASQLIALECSSCRGPFNHPLLLSALKSGEWPVTGKRDRKFPGPALWFICDYGSMLAPAIREQCVSIRFDSHCGSESGVPWPQDASDRSLETVVPGFLRAALTLISAWIAAGRPSGRHRRSRLFGNWESAMGGILETAGMSTFSGLDDRRPASDRRSDLEREQFFAALREAEGSHAWKAQELLRFCLDRGLLAQTLGTGSERSKVTRLGIELQRLAGKSFGDLRLVRADPRPGATWAGYRLVRDLNHE